MPPPPPPAALPDDLLEETFLRLPPSEPACLVRASMASKEWLNLLTGPRFRTRYREFHETPPMLGFFYSCPPDNYPEEKKDGNLPYFVATTTFAVRIWKSWHKDYAPWDCRHGRVPFANNSITPVPLVVWDPMTGRRSLLDGPEDYDSSGAAVLCNVTGCDHLACHAGPFQVVFVGLHNTDVGSVAYGHVSLPEAGQWSKPCSLDLATEDAFIVDRPPVFIHDALYFMLTYGNGDHDGGNADGIVFLKYDLSSNCLSLIRAPKVEVGLAGETILMAMEDGSLGFAHVDGFTLNLWSMHIPSNGVASWNRCRVINLETLLHIPSCACEGKLRLIGSVEGSDIIFLTTDLDIYKINLKPLWWKKLGKRENCIALFPYMSFYNPPERVSFSGAAR